MKKIYQSLDQLVGRTPLLELTQIEREYKLEAKLVAKLEGFNPAGSVSYTHLDVYKRQFPG